MMQQSRAAERIILNGNPWNLEEYSIYNIYVMCTYMFVTKSCNNLRDCSTDKREKR